VSWVAPFVPHPDNATTANNVRTGPINALLCIRHLPEKWVSYGQPGVGYGRAGTLGHRESSIHGYFWFTWRDVTAHSRPGLLERRIERAELSTVHAPRGPLRGWRVLPGEVLVSALSGAAPGRATRNL
jgi:hypothetical protein